MISKLVVLQIKRSYKAKLEYRQQEDLNSVIAWSIKNKILLHEDKFVYL